MRIAIAGARVTAPVAKRVELFDITKRRARLLRDEGAQRYFEGAMAQGIEFSRGQGEEGFGRVGNGQNQGFVVLGGDDCRGQADRQRQTGPRRRIFLCEAHEAQGPKSAAAGNAVT